MIKYDWEGGKINNIISGGKAEIVNITREKLTISSQEVKMNSSSKSMVQAVTLLTALRMFTNGKFTFTSKLFNDDDDF